MTAEKVEAVLNQDCLIIDYVLENCHRAITLSDLFEEAKSMINSHKDMG